jgi:tight adherence protein C
LPAKHVAGSQRTGWHAVLASLSRLSVPAGAWQDSQRRLQFIRAGFREASAAQAYYAFKTAFALVLPLLLALVLMIWWPATPYTRLAMYVVSLAVAGYYLPDVYLRFRTQRRAEEMRDTLPDLIDLLVICTESGLGMDAAINRVSQEIARSSKILAEEFYLAALEIRAGAGRSTALKNLALRVDLEDLHSLVSMLVQADRFGTSLADSLRIQSEVMRTKRMQRAEEIAAKVPVKMLIPLICFIFPSLLMVLIGPAVLQISAIFAK